MVHLKVSCKSKTTRLISLRHDRILRRMSQLHEGTKLLRAFLDQPGNDPMRVALDAGLSLSSILRYRAGKTPKSKAARAAIERATGGVVLASSWDR
jgi:hypothetical protein